MKTAIAKLRDGTKIPVTSLKIAIAKLRDGREAQVGYFYEESKIYPLIEIGGKAFTWTLKGEIIRNSEDNPQDIINIDDVLHDLSLPNTSYVVKTLANTKWSELPESKLRAMYDLLTGE